MTLASKAASAVRRLTQREAPPPAHMPHAMGHPASAGFDHAEAQRYELRAAAGTVREHFPRVYGEWEACKAMGELWASAREWLENDADYNAFVEHARTRKCVEVGAGPFGFLPLCDWIADRAVIDPLADDYRRLQIEMTGNTFYSDNLKRYAQPAEQFIPELKGTVDGAIISRNAIDHAEDPMTIIYNLSQYAAPGCYLLFWGEIWHLEGCDEGHRNITKTPAAFEALLNGLGFDIVPPGSFQRNNPGLLDYGCVARKR